MSPRIRFLLVILLALVLFSMGQQAWCDSGLHSLATDASRSTTTLLLVGEFALLKSGSSTQPEMLQGAKALVTTGILTEMIKRTVREKRPNSGARNSFPSGHTSAAFAMATVVADYKPQYKLLAYGTAAVIGWSRVEVEAHHWQDVVAGAALGYFTAKHFTGQHLNVTPNGVEYNWKW